MSKEKSSKKISKENMLLYVIAAAAVAILAWAVLSILGTGVGSANYNYYQQANAGGCGDLNDVANVQHLSHHPSQYADCIRQVSPEMFKQAVGTDKSAFMQQNGIT
ncbi:MAG: hypothetical protein WA139_02900 [Candidatus Aenigmatarchaeota archaeon]